jgi:hypothetical protein
MTSFLLLHENYVFFYFFCTVYCLGVGSDHLTLYDHPFLLKCSVKIVRSCRILLMISEFLSQVNRELMELIESLQSRIVEEENVELSEEESLQGRIVEEEYLEEQGEESDGSHEKLDESDMNCAIMEEVKDTAQIESGIRQADKLKKARGGKCTLKRGRKKERTSPKQPDASDVENGVDPLKPKMADSKEPEDPAIQSKVRQTGKRKQYKHGDGGNSSTLNPEVKTRSKRAKMQVIE